MRQFMHTLTIAAPATLVVDAFFDADALAAWWQARRSLCVARPLGSFAVEWDTTDWRDDLLGRLGGAFRGTVIDYKPGREFFVADAYWLPPDGGPIGPMALEVTCVSQLQGTVLRVRQSGWEDAPRWSRYYDVLDSGFKEALSQLKRHVEARASGAPRAEATTRAGA
jgi:uncharacterized protein YndB with AHSA1/START domain